MNERKEAFHISKKELESNEEDAILCICDLINEGYSESEIRRIYRRGENPKVVSAFSGIEEKKFSSIFKKALKLRKKESFISTNELMEDQIITTINGYKKAYRLACTGIVTANNPFPLYKPNPEAAARILNDLVSFLEKMKMDLSLFLPEELKKSENEREGEVLTLVRDVYTNKKDS